MATRNPKSQKDNWVSHGKRVGDKVLIGVLVVVVFAAARNTITWHLQRFWGASGNFWQTNWEKIYDMVGGSPILLGFIGTYLVTNVFYWTANALLMAVDLSGKPEFLLKYKVQEDKNVPMDREKFLNALWTVVYNQTVIAIPVSYLGHQASCWRGCDFGRELPMFYRVLAELLVCVLVEEICFYYSHRLLHHPALYKHIHKKHHEWTAPIGIISLYSHPVEHVCSNLLPAFMGPFLLGSHVTVSWLWFTLALLSTSNAHSGYHLPFMPSPEFHDYHHLKFNQCYGALGILDALHNTDDQFRRSLQYQRHYLVTDLVPVLQVVPEQDKESSKSE